MAIDERDRLYIDGQWVAALGASSSIEVINATTEEVMGRVPSGDASDIDRAVVAARAAFGGWSTTDREERAKCLQRITEGLQGRMMEIATVVAQEVGMPINLAMLIQAGLPIMTFSSVGELLRTFAFEEQLGNSLVVREPVGVVGAITPWNYPLHQVAAKVALALAAGCTVVVKPSEVAPLSAFILAEVIDGAGLPPGVFNLVTGFGPVAGEALAAHPDVDMISFTGSTRAGRRVGELAAASVKRVALELGGKSPNVILDDADVGRAVPDGVAKAFLNSGQTCSALTRMIVPRARLAEVEQLAVEAALSYTPGDPLTQGTRLGPLASAAQRSRVRDYITAGLDGGAKLLCGGVEPPEGLDRGFFVRPTVFSEVDPDSVIAQEEIFGPVLAIIAYDTEAEAVEIANHTPYGLAAGVWAGDRERALAVARQLRAGQVEINGGSFNPLAPFGGYKQSGNGRELGRFGLEEFLEVKSLQL
jgi:acyl-CoA reductase-like NAD-dependent aldehyde dehydrogenase